MLSRTANGKLNLKALDLKIFIGELFKKCKTESEVEWVQEQLTSCTECEAEKRIDEIEEG